MKNCCCTILMFLTYHQVRNQKYPSKIKAGKEDTEDNLIPSEIPEGLRLNVKRQFLLILHEAN